MSYQTMLFKTCSMKKISLRTLKMSIFVLFFYMLAESVHAVPCNTAMSKCQPMSGSATCAFSGSTVQNACTWSCSATSSGCGGCSNSSSCYNCTCTTTATPPSNCATLNTCTGSASPGTGYTCPTANSCTQVTNGAVGSNNTYSCVSTLYCTTTWTPPPPANCATLHSCTGTPSPGAGYKCPTANSCTQVTNGTVGSNNTYSCVSTPYCTTTWTPPPPSNCASLKTCTGTASPGGGYTCPTANSCTQVTNGAVGSDNTYNCVSTPYCTTAWTKCITCPSTYSSTTFHCAGGLKTITCNNNNTCQTGYYCP